MTDLVTDILMEQELEQEMEQEREQVRAPIPPQVMHLTREKRYCFDLERAKDRLSGMVLGAALGDAVCLQVEGDEPGIISERHPQGVNYPYRGAYRGYPNGDWTDSTDFIVITMRVLKAYFDRQSNDPVLDMATKISHWRNVGFQELGDTGGSTPESVVARVLTNPDFLKDPIKAAAEVKGPKAENGGMVRCIPCAFTAAPADWAADLCEVTHADDRCVASAVTLATLLSSLARLDGPTPPALSLEAVRAGCEKIAEEPRKIEFIKRLTDTKKIEALQLGERENRSSTLKACAVALWAFRQLVRTPAAKRGGAFFKEAVRAVAAQGGDASANGAVAGAVLGAAMGAGALPEDWAGALPNRKWLTDQVEAFYAAAQPTWEMDE